MAVIIDEEKKPVNWLMLGIVIAVVVIVFVGGYYLFFKKPELIETVAPQELDRLNSLSQVSFDPAGVLNSSVFKALRQYTTPPVLPTAGRDNPFEIVR